MKKSLTLILCGIFSCMYTQSTPILPQTGTGVEDIRSNLYVKQDIGAPILLDGDLTEYYPSFSNNLDGMDARKMSNFSENLGMLRSNYVLVVERRETINVSDTIFYKIWQMQQRPYQLEFITTNLNHPGLEGYLEDTYLHTSTPIDLNGRTTADFTITIDPASAAVYRFRIIFKTAVAGPLPLTLTSINAYRQNGGIRMEWKTENESNTDGYLVQKSIDGNHFSGIINIMANNFPLNNYTWLDKNPSRGDNYYRLLSTEKDGKKRYSRILKVFNGEESAGVNVYPNPLTNNTLHIQMAAQLPGLYQIRLFNNSGQLVLHKKVYHNGGNLNETLQLNQSTEKGVYQLEIVSPTNIKTAEKVVY